MEWGSSKSRSIGGFDIGRTLSLRKNILRIIVAALCYFNVCIVPQHLFMRATLHEFLHNACYLIHSRHEDLVCRRLQYFHLLFNCSSIHLAIPGQKNMHIFVSVKVSFAIVFPHIPFCYPLNSLFPLILYLLISLNSQFYHFFHFYFLLRFHNSFTSNFHFFWDYFSCFCLLFTVDSTIIFCP